MTEKDVLALTKNSGSMANAVNQFPAVQLQLADGSIYNHEGTVVKSTGNIDATTGTIQMIAHFANPEHLLKSGGSGQIVVPRTDSHAILIPQSATTQVQNKIFVYKVSSDNKVHYSEIKVDPQNDGLNYIVVSGLKPGEKIVTKGLTSLTDGQAIKPLSEAEYDEAVKKAEALGEKQGSAGGFLEAMTGGKDKKNK